MDTTPQPIPNPYARSDDYRCFGCSPNNPIGLQLKFFLDGRRVTSQWQPRADLEGYPGVTHGGVLATLCDEVAAWYLHVVLGTAGMTRELQISYQLPARAADAPFHIEAHAVEEGQKNAVIEVSVHGRSGTLFCTAQCSFAVFSEAVARRRFRFPGREAFQPQG